MLPSKHGYGKINLSETIYIETNATMEDSMQTGKIKIATFLLVVHDTFHNVKHSIRCWLCSVATIIPWLESATMTLLSNKSTVRCLLSIELQ